MPGGVAADVAKVSCDVAVGELKSCGVNRKTGLKVALAPAGSGVRALIARFAPWEQPKAVRVIE